jgi:8-amino-7-oxononanoate synthase
MVKFNFLKNQLDFTAKKHRLRALKQISSQQGPTVYFAEDPNKMINLFCSNNYLNIAEAPDIKMAVTAAVEKFGFGSAASRLISGTMTPHVELENKMAKYFKKESALLFPSGWTANQAILSTLPQKDDIVLLDKFDHASIIDPAVACPAVMRTYRRDRIEKLEKHLAQKQYDNKFIVSESLFSMDGDTANLKLLVELKNKNNAILILDEAHSVGCLGKQGRGLADQQNLLDQIDILISPLGKAFAANGCIVAANKSIIDYLINKARPFIYTTAPSPVLCAAISAALEIIKNQPQRREKLAKNARRLREKLTAENFDIANSTTHIVPVIIGSEENTIEISNKLLQDGHYLCAIRPPTVPPGTSRLRISLQSAHTTRQIESLVESLKKHRTCSGR